MGKTTMGSIDDLKFHEQNANRGTERGRDIIRNSMKKRGIGRGVLAASDGTLIAGTNATQVARELGKKVRFIETTGDELLVNVRTDLDPASDEAKLLGYEDNRAGELGLDWDDEQIQADLDEGLDLGDAGFDGAELDDLFDEEEGKRASPAPTDKVPVTRVPLVKVVMRVDDVTTFERAMATVPTRNRGEALLTICKAFLGEGEDDDEVEDLE